MTADKKHLMPWDAFGPTRGAPYIERWRVTQDGEWRVRLRDCDGEITTDDVDNINSLRRFRNLAASQLGKFFPAMKQSEWSHHLVDQQRILVRERKQKQKPDEVMTHLQTAAATEDKL